MKTITILECKFNDPFQARLATLFSGIFLLIGIINLNAQPFGTGDAVIGAALSPPIHWQHEFSLPDNGSVPQNQDDWYYDLTELKTAGITTGYLAVGYARDRDFTSITFNDVQGQVLACASEDLLVTQPNNCQQFFLPSDPIRHNRQAAVWYDLEGNVTNYRLFNWGEFRGVVQDTDGSIYLFGTSFNIRNLTASVEFSPTTDPHLQGPIRYNPSTTSSQQFALSCDGLSEPFRRKANVLKLSSTGTVLWNNYYGLENSILAARPLRGNINAGLLTNGRLIVGGFSEVAPDLGHKFMVNLDKSNGNIIWKATVDANPLGEIFQINRNGNSYIISGMEAPASGSIRQAFAARVQDAFNGGLSVNSFRNPAWYHNTNSIAPNISSLALDNSLTSFSTSAIFVGSKIYWFIIANNTINFAVNGIARGLIVELNAAGAVLADRNIGEIRAFDLWFSGIPTNDGGFAIITSRHSPYYFGGSALPSAQTPLNLTYFQQGTIGDCVDEFLDGFTCNYLTDPTSDFWKLMSTCSYVQKYNANFELEWDKIWDSSNNSPRECLPGNFKQQECMYRIIQSSVDGGLLAAGNSSNNKDDCYIVKLRNDCGISDFYGGASGPDLIATYGNTNLNGEDGITNITTNTVWNTPKKVLGTVRVKPGFTLTIQNTVVEFAQGNSPHAGIDVEQNGHLIVDNSVLTSGGECDQFWAGISVWGDSDEHQYAYSGGQYHQGRATIRNNSTIEYAATGVRNWNPGKWDQIGGIIDVKDSEFQNCSRGIEFVAYQNFAPTGLPYTRPERSIILSTDFIVNDLIPIDLSSRAPTEQITMWRTDRLIISGCGFINNSSPSQSEYFGNAIYSEDANYQVIGRCLDPIIQAGVPCQNLQRNTFTGWHKAIEALGSETSRAMTVRESDFSENMIGVEINGADYSQIYSNQFEMGGHPFEIFVGAEVDDQNHLGIYSNTNIHYSIEDNSFTRPQGAAFDGHGVLVYHGEGAENQVYNNDFSNLKTGANGWQVNRNTEFEGGVSAGLAGLQFICNTNENNEVDFEISRTGIPGDLGFDGAGIRQNQGASSPQISAGNLFSNPDPSPLVYTHFTVDSEFPYKYYWKNNSPVAAEITPGTMLIQAELTTTNYCPSNYTIGGGTTELVGHTELVEKKTEYGSLLYTYHQLIDEGDTPAAVAEVELTWPEDAWDLRNELMSRSPYNSEEVLIAAIQKDIMPHAMLLEVLLANPDALRTGDVIGKAESIPNPPMPEYMIDLLWASRSQPTLRTEMEATIADLHMEVQRIQKKIILSKAFADETYNAPDSMLYYLSQVKTVEGNYTRAAALADRGMYAQSVALLDSMQYHYKLKDARHNEMDQLKDFFQLLGSVHSSGRNMARLDANEINSLKGIAENPDAGLAAQKAQNALCFHYDICYDAQGRPKNKATQREPKPAYEALVAKLNTASAYPNPSDQYITIAYNLLFADPETRLMVFDGLGRLVEDRILGEVYEGQEILDTRKLSDGVYIYQIVQNDQKRSEGKFIIAH